MNEISTDDIMNDTSHEGWCSSCGNTQGINHLGSQFCKVCGACNWVDVVSFRKYREAQKDNFEEIGKR